MVVPPSPRLSRQGGKCVRTLPIVILKRRSLALKNPYIRNDRPPPRLWVAQRFTAAIS
jgi:hypothetical protein